MRSTELVPANLRSILSRMKQAGTVKAASIQAEGGESLMVRQASAGGTTAATRTIMEHDRARVGVARGRTGHASGASATWARVGGGGSAGAGASDSEQRVSAAQGPPPTRGRTARRQYFTGTQATFRLSPLLWPGLFRFCFCFVFLAGWERGSDVSCGSLPGQVGCCEGSDSARPLQARRTRAAVRGAR